MLNVGLKDVRIQLVTGVRNMRIVSNGASSVSMSFGGIPTYPGLLVVDGSSSASMTIVKQSLLRMVSNGASSVEMTFLKDPSVLPLVEVITFDSPLTLEVTNESPLLTTHEGISKVRTIITDLSTIK